MFEYGLEGRQMHFLVTHTVYLRVGPSDTQEGDEVAALSGGKISLYCVLAETALS